MAPRSRLRKDNSSTSEQLTSNAAAAPQLPPRDDQPLKTLILPEGASSDARIVSLANPSTNKLSRYLYCPSSGFYEFTHIGTKSSKPQSCLLVPKQAGDSLNGSDRSDTQETSQSALGNGYVTQDAQILVATPLDPKVLLIPLFKPGLLNKQGRPHMARVKEDLFDDLSVTSKHMQTLLRYPSVRRLLEEQLEDVCDCVDALDDTVYRPNSMLLLTHLVAKAQAVVANAWPPSLEKHIQKQLEIPAAIAIMKKANELSVESQSLNDTESNTAPEDTQHMPGDSEESSLEPSDEVVEQLRLRTALDFILSSYVPFELKTYFESISSSDACELVDFKKMKYYLQRVEKLKTEAQALRSISDNVSRKRAAEDDDEAQEARNEKKRKKEEEERNRKQQSRATKDLKKVNTSGMKKMSSFFTKKTASPAG